LFDVLLIDSANHSTENQAINLIEGTAQAVL